MYGDVQGCMVMCRRCMCIPTFTVKKKTNPSWITKEILNKIKNKKGYGAK